MGAVEAADLLDVDLLTVGPSSALRTADGLHVGELSDEAGVLLRLRLLILLLLQD